MRPSHPSLESRKNLRAPSFLLAPAVLPLALLFACAGEEKTPPPPAAPVSVAQVVQKDVARKLQAIGMVEAYSTVQVKSMVTGELVHIHFREGQEVKRGELLFRIDRRPFETALEQAEAGLERARAGVEQAEANLGKEAAQVKQAAAVLERDLTQKANAEVQAERYRLLLEKGYVAREQYDQLRTQAESFEAMVRADRAALENARAAERAARAAVEDARAARRAAQAVVENARLQLSYCLIHSPLDGRTGQLAVNRGNLVKANETPLVDIHQIHPIAVSFAVPEQHLGEIRRSLAKGRPKVQALLPQEEETPEEGALTFLDNKVDRATGTIRLKGTFPNKDRRLWPGQFVNVVLILAVQQGRMVIPSGAVLTGQEGSFAFVVRPDLTVESRPLVVGSSQDGEVVVERGLQPGERVVTEGHIRLAPGIKVEIKNRPEAGR